MRKVEPLRSVSLQGLEVADVVGETPELRMVSPTDLFIDEEYQRQLSKRSVALIRRIHAGWSWRKYKAPVVVERDGRYEVLDGQHTAIGAATRGIPEIPVLVTKASSKKDRAAAFIGHNTDRINVTPLQLHASAVVAGDPTAVAIDAIARELSVRVLRAAPGNGRYEPCDTVAVAALRAILKRRGEAGLRRILNVVARARPAPVAQMHLLAVEHLLFSEERANEVNVPLLVKALERDVHREASVLVATHDIPLWRAAAIIYFRSSKMRRRDCVA